jgi:AraC family ethanolamine operon transcriptional activator
VSDGASRSTLALTPSPTDGGAAGYSVTRVASSDIDEQAASLREWDQVYTQLTPGHFTGGLHEASFRGVQIFRETTNQSVHQAGKASAGVRAFGVPVQMHGNALMRGETVDTKAMLTFGGDEELDLYAPPGFEVLALAVDEDLLDAYSMRIESRRATALIGEKHVFRPAPERIGHFRRLLASVLQSLETEPTVLQSVQAQRLLEQLLLNELLELIGDIEEARARTPPCGGRQHLVEAARAYMSAHIDEPITIAELCLQLNVCRRTLQYAFNDVLNLNAVRFLRALRLNGVRRELKAAVPAPRVQDAAAKWGFWHLGHFVTDYKHMFGELPSETLRRRSAEL